VTKPKLATHLDKQDPQTTLPQTNTHEPQHALWTTTNHTPLGQTTLHPQKQKHSRTTTSPLEKQPTNHTSPLDKQDPNHTPPTKTKTLTTPFKQKIQHHKKLPNKQK